MRKDRASWGYRVGETWGWRGGFLEDEETHRERCLGSWIGAEGLRALAGASRSKGKENSWSSAKVAWVTGLCRGWSGCRGCVGRPSQGGGFAGLGRHPSNFALPWGTTQCLGLLTG